MKHSRSIALILALLMALTLASCSRGGANADTDAGTDADTASSGMTEADAKRILEEFFTPTPTDYAVEDGKCYFQTDYKARGVRFFSADIYSSSSDDTLRYMVDIDEKTEPTLACTIEGCTHDDVRCPAWNQSSWLIVNPENDDVIIYFQPTTYGRKIGYKIGDYVVETEDRINALFEYNMTKGTLRCIGNVPVNNANDAYYNGFIYDSYVQLEDIYDEDGMNLIWIKPVVQLTCIDTRTGKSGVLQENGENISALFLGVYNDRVYCIRDGGDLLSCSLDLSEYEVAANIGEDYMLPQNPSTVLSGIVYGDFLMFLKKDPDTPDGERGVQEPDFDLYQIDLSSGNFEPELVSHDVRQMRIDYEHLYYWEYGGDREYYIYDPATREATL